jgi:hypothetical protein
MGFKEYITEGTTIKKVYHGGKIGLKKLDPDYTKSLVFGKGVYFTSNLDSAKKYAFEKYGENSAVYSADISINNDAKSALKYKSDISFDGLIFKLSSGFPNEINYIVRSTDQINNLKPVKI